MKFILGTKQNMAQVFDENGVHPVTIVVTGPNTVTHVKTKEKDGYAALQIGYGEKKAKNLSKALKGHLKDHGNFRYIKEYRVKNGELPAMNVGDKIEPSAFAVGDKVVVRAISKGKGFQGVVKRHGFKGGPRSHGQKHSEREPGSISHGLRTGPRRGLRMAGRMGADTITVKNLKVIDVQADHILISGAIPGRRGTLVEVRG
jgi:large subunit ribosomal protein L3